MRGQLFYLNKSDRRILLALLAVIGVALVVIFIAGGDDRTDASPLALSAPIADSLAVADHEPYYAQPTVEAERFPFDPNTADSTQLLRLGLQSWQVRNVYKYRAAGGIYRRKEDFARLYGLTAGQYRELEPYITIGADYRPAADLFASRPTTAAPADSTPTHRYPVKLEAGQTIDLATADTTQLQSVPGIGPYFARRIVEYGRRLGGYVSVDQLTEIDDFPQESLSYLTLGSTPEVSRLNINMLSVDQLKRHPYINFYMARAIVNYRRLHGTISDLDDLHLLPEFPPEVIERLRPYVTY